MLLCHDGRVAVILCEVRTLAEDDNATNSEVRSIWRMIYETV